MAYSHYERLSALDSTFLDIEDHNVHMHVGAVGIFDGRPLLTADGGLDIERVVALAETQLQRTPRFRQKLQRIPLFNHPVWVDDDRFNLQYHVRHTSLPRPGDVRQLKRLAGRIMSQQLDRGKPLWEMWFVDGLENDKVAVITKAHHAMVDGVSGVDLLASIMVFDPKVQPGKPKRWIPRPAPSASQLLLGELQRRATLPLALALAGQEVVSRPRRTVSIVRDAIEGLGQAIAAGLRPASPTPLNPDIGPHRRFDWTHFDLNAVKKVKNHLGGTINDVVLATVAGALRRFLKGRGLEVKNLDLRSMVPVSVRTETQRGALGNRVSFLVAQLPVDERDPRARMKRVIETTQKLKHSKQVFGAEVLEEISDWTFTSLFVEFARMAAVARSYNLVVTNVPGPPAPVYMLGGRMEEIYPLVPLFTNQALGIALFSYSGGLYWGFNADWDALPDLHDLVEAVDVEFKALCDAAAAVAVPVLKAEAKPGRVTGSKRTNAKQRAA